MPIVDSADRRVKRWPRWIGLSLLALLLVIGTVALWAFGVARFALPQLDGTLVAPGLQRKVVVTRDAHGVPTLDAVSLPDLFFAQGYVTAQDRLWQMDIMRRFALGRLAEVVGADGLAHDKQQRILGIPQVAHRSAAGLSARDREYFAAYARGVNASIEHSRAHLPLEFRILNYSPDPWTVDDCFAVGAELAQELNHGRYRYALLREQFQAAIGPELTADLFVNGSRHDHPPGLETAELPVSAAPSTDEEDDEDMGFDPEPVTRNAAPRALPAKSLSAEFLDGSYELAPGSNNWAVSGAHTVSGKPLLSNDMHLGHQMPNLWYEAHLRSGGFDVVGVTLPGMPFVVVGHNQRIAWGFTNVEPTVQDLYVETFDGEGRYQTPQGFLTPEQRSEVIHVKGAADVTLQVAVTRHGPIITDLVPGETRKLALRWTLYDSFTDPFFDLNSAQNWSEFRQAAALLHSPGQNMMYADIDGHIGYQATGQYPIRKAGEGSLPVAGNDDAHEWEGWVPFEKLPSVFDPPSGVLATANGRITPDKYPYAISTMWDAPWRTNRIYRVLNSGKRLAPADMLALQTDVDSAFDHACAERFVQALEKAPALSERARRARDLLRDWDGRLSADSPAATVEIRSRRELTRLLLQTQLEAPGKAVSVNGTALTWESYHWSMSSIWLENMLAQQPKRWLPAKYGSFDLLVVAAVEAAVAEPEAPVDLTQWTWGKASPLEIRHLVLSKLPLVGRWTGPGIHPQSGGSFTVKQVGRSFGPSERFTADLGDLDGSMLNTVTGQGGNFLSPYYMDQWEAWFEGSTFALPFSKDAVERGRVHELVLTPANK
jgi:penicillin G amidase